MKTNINKTKAYLVGGGIASLASAATFVILATIGGIALSAGAASSDTFSPGKFMSFGGKFRSEEQKEEFQAKIAERKAEMEARREAINAAIGAGDYNAWLKVTREDCLLTEKINEDNFPRFMEAHQKMQEAQTIMEELGIERGGLGHFGHQKRGLMRHWR